MSNTLTKELVVASLIPEVARNNIQQLIEVGKGIIPTEETIKVDYENLLKIRDMWTLLEKRRKEEDAQDRERIKARKEGYDKYMKPMEEILEAAEPILAAINHKLWSAEKDVVESIKLHNERQEALTSFVNEIAKAVAVAPDSKELVMIQKLIGTEKSKSSFYGEYKSKMVDGVCDALLSMIAERKQILKENQKVQHEYDTWLAAGDIDKAAQLKDTIELNNIMAQQNIERIADGAFQQISSILPVSTNFESATIHPRLHRWSWRVDDIELLYKKNPPLVSKEPNKKAINDFMKEKSDADELKLDCENNFNGLVVWRKPFFVSVKTSNDAS